MSCPVLLLPATAFQPLRLHQHIGKVRRPVALFGSRAIPEPTNEEEDIKELFERLNQIQYELRGRVCLLRGQIDNVN